MKLSDIIELAKAGYTPKDVKMLLEYVETSPAVKEASVDEAKSKEEEKQEQKEQNGSNRQENKNAEEIFKNILLEN